MLELSTERAAAAKKAAKVLKFAKSLTGKLINDRVILPEDAEIVQYGLENLAGSLSGIIISLTVGRYFSHTVHGLILWMLILPLRRNAGGFHAATRSRCLFISAGALILAFICMIQPAWSVQVHMFITTFFGGIIFLTAPVGNPNKLLDETEYRVYRKRTRIILFLESMLSVLAWKHAWQELSAITTSCFSIVGLALIAGRINLRVHLEKRKEV